MERVVRLGASARPRVRRPRLPVRWLAALVVLALLLGGGWLWLRTSSLVEVRDVAVVGISSSEGPQVREALRAAALDMTTLDVREEELREAVGAFTSVAGLRVQPDFPHGLTIEVLEREPVAVVSLGGSIVPVGAGGRLMRGVRVDGPMPAVRATRVGPGGRLTDRAALGAVEVLAQAPPQLRARVKRAFSGPKGLAVDLRNGPQLIFGSASDANLKWMAAARVLAEPSAAGAVYLDVRVPRRVAAGGLGTVPQEAPTANPQAPEANPQPQPEITPSLEP